MPSSKRRLASLSSTTRILAFRISAELINGLRPSCELQSYIQCTHELVDIDRFSEVPEESRLQALLNIARHRICAEGDDGDMRRRWILAENLQSFNSTDPRQIDIHQDDIRLVKASE